jgi:hypothetical protein
MSLTSIYNQKQKVINNAVGSFVKGAKNTEIEISQAVFSLLRRANNKDLSILEKAKVINEIEVKVFEIIRKSEYKSSVQKFLGSLKEIETLQKKTMLEATGIKGGKVKFNELSKFASQSINDNFLGKGLDANVVQPLKQRIGESLISGADNTQLESVVSQYFESDEKLGRLTRYVNAIANDALQNYGGLINNEYRKEYQLTKFRYVGSLIEDSRGQCRHWTSKDVITEAELIEEIPIAIAGGFLGGFKCSGMAEWTNIDNFTIERGGYNCRHEAIPTF